MIQNEALKERKVKDYQKPYNPPEVPPQYKSRAERRGDTAKQEQQAITKLQSLFDFDVRGIYQVMSDIRKVRNEDGLIILGLLQDGRFFVCLIQDGRFFFFKFKTVVFSPLQYYISS